MIKPKTSKMIKPHAAAAVAECERCGGSWLVRISTRPELSR